MAALGRAEENKAASRRFSPKNEKNFYFGKKALG